MMSLPFSDLFPRYIASSWLTNPGHLQASQVLCPIAALVATLPRHVICVLLHAIKLATLASGLLKHFPFLKGIRSFTHGTPKGESCPALKSRRVLSRPFKRQIVSHITGHAESPSTACTYPSSKPTIRFWMASHPPTK